MTRINIYAVVSKTTNEVLGRFVNHPSHPVPKHINNMTLGYVKDGKLLSTEAVFLSSSKGNIDKLEALSLEKNDQLCVIDGVKYELDVISLIH